MLEIDFFMAARVDCGIDFRGIMNLKLWGENSVQMVGGKWISFLKVKSSLHVPPTLFIHQIIHRKTAIAIKELKNSRDSSEIKLFGTANVITF